MALAKALYKNAPILLLDEPTAALDPIAEQEMYLQKEIPAVPRAFRPRSARRSSPPYPFHPIALVSLHEYFRKLLFRKLLYLFNIFVIRSQCKIHCFFADLR